MESSDLFGVFLAVLGVAGSWLSWFVRQLWASVKVLAERMAVLETEVKNGDRERKAQAEQNNERSTRLRKIENTVLTRPDLDKAIAPILVLLHEQAERSESSRKEIMLISAREQARQEIKRNGE